MQAALDAGATLVGKSHTDEMAFGLIGTNAHYGTPLNPRGPGRAPGGSSSGSASAVAGGVADFGLGTDTAGSIRVPAAYCGLFGMRPTHGVLPVQGMIPLAPSFDTVGVLARTGAVLSAVTTGLLAARFLGADTSGEAWPAGEIVMLEDALELADAGVRHVVEDRAEALAALVGAPLRRVPIPAVVRADGGSPEEWRRTCARRQLTEVWETHGRWVRDRRPAFGPGVAERFADAEAGAPTGRGDALRARAQIRWMTELLLPHGGVLGLPTAPTPAPLLAADGTTDAGGTVRLRTVRLTCIASLAGLPAVSLPLGTVDGAPVGLCLLGRPGEDRSLLGFARAADALVPDRGPCDA